MRTFRIMILGFVALLLSSKWGVSPHADAEALQGTWEIVSVARAGKIDPTPVGFTIRFVGDEVHFQVPLDEPMWLLPATVAENNPERMARAAMS